MNYEDVLFYFGWFMAWCISGIMTSEWLLGELPVTIDEDGDEVIEASVLALQLLVIVCWPVVLTVRFLAYTSRIFRNE